RLGPGRQALARPRPPAPDCRSRHLSAPGKGNCLMNQFRLSRRPDIGEKIRVSFEFFPPKSDEMEARLWDTVTRLAPLHPHFVSVTYGAGGSTRERTVRTVRRILAETDLMPAAH